MENLKELERSAINNQGNEFIDTNEYQNKNIETI